MVIGADSPNQSLAGIRVRYNAALVVSNTSVIEQGVGMLIDPPTGQWVSGVYVHDSFFDNNKNQNLKINPTGTGSVTRIRFASTWFGSSHTADGVLISNGGSGALDGVHFIDPQIVLNVGSGLSTTGTVTDILVMGGTIGGNAHGLYFNSGASKINVIGASIGAYGGLSGNTGSGVVALSGVTNLNLIGNQLAGNTTAFSDATGNVTKNIIGNVGVNPMSNNITVTASPFGFTNTTGAALNVYINGGTVSSVTVEGNTVATATNELVTLPPGKAMIVTYSVAPTMKYTSIQ